MSEIIKEILKNLPECTVVILPQNLDVQVEGINVARHSLDIVEYRDVDGNVLHRHTVLG